ncbi:conserved hypothetical protein [Frankia sp. Hr75.2]|nr:conserved hypothetical protein [Frankia sp. Hr75.2]
MTAVRALHQLTGPDSDLATLVEYTAAVRTQPGCREAECYRRLDGRPGAAVVELWDDEHAHAQFWAAALKDGTATRLVGAAGGEPRPEPASEFYRHQYFENDGGEWKPLGSAAKPRAISWASAAAVRVVVQVSVHDTERVRPMFLANTAETLREPGCREFAWYRSEEFDGQLLLLELWDSQPLYDSHWALRRRTSDSASPPQPPPRRNGTNGAEFYRHRTYTHLYDRWLPAGDSGRSETVVWPD